MAAGDTHMPQGFTSVRVEGVWLYPSYTWAGWHACLAAMLDVLAECTGSRLQAPQGGVLAGEDACMRLY